jgi:transposase
MLNILGLKSRNSITVPLDLPDVTVLSIGRNEQRDVVITVASTLVGTPCQHCGQPLTKRHGRDRWLELRHLPILGQCTFIRLQPERYECPSCAGKSTTQQLAWYESKSPHTKAYDEHLLLQLINSTVEDVSRKEAVGYDAVEGALGRWMHSQVIWAEFTELGTLGIDEIALTKGHANFVAIITSQQADGHVALLAVLADRKKASVRQFLDPIPPHLRATLHTVCTDMWDGYVNAVKEFAAAHDDVTLAVVIDRFHVAKHYRDGVDQLRKRECRRLKAALPKAEYAELKEVMWPLRKNHRDLTLEERLRLLRLFTDAPTLKVADTLREELTAIFELPLTQAQAKKRLLKGCAKVRRSALTWFDPFLRVLQNTAAVRRVRQNRQMRHGVR